MTLGVAEQQGDLLDDVTGSATRRSTRTRSTPSCTASATGSSPTRPSPTSSTTKGRRSVPPSVVAVVMVLQRLEGLSDREAVERYCFDTRWRYAAGVGGYDTAGLDELRPHRARRHARAPAALRASRPRLRGRARRRPRRPGSSAAGGCSTRPRSMTRWRRWTPSPSIRSAIRGLLKVADAELGAELRARAHERRRLRQLGQAADRLGRRRGPRGAHRQPGQGRLRLPWPLLDGRELDDAVLARPPRLLATVLGQDLEEGDDGVLAHRPQGGQRPGDLDRRPRGPPRPQDRGQGLRRLQGPRRDRPRLRDHHRHHRHPGQRRRRQRGRRPHRRPARRGVDERRRR